MRISMSAFLGWFLIGSFTLVAHGQPRPANYPQGYFRDPLNIPISLSGNFGELRPGHYHMGLDIKTMAKQNLPVYAAADGYIARIKIEPAGFGRAIYINHPNGFTTLYAHLNDFFPGLESWVKAQQYKQEHWNVFLLLPPGLFPVKKGDLIAYSGTTGGSQAPHLHFEVRRTGDDVNLNPLLFGLPLEDRVRPSILRLAVYDRRKSTYEQSPRIYPVKRSAEGVYTLPGVITAASDKVSFAISAYDTHTGSSNLNGIYESSLYNNGVLVSGFQLREVSYNSTRYINANIDYKTRANGGSFFQHLSELPGYVNSIYFKPGGDGVIDLGDGAVHDVKITAADPYGNSSELNFRVQHTGANAAAPEPAGKVFYPLMVDVYEGSDCEFYIGETCLYDSVHIRESHINPSNPVVVSAVHTIGAAYIPLQDSFLVRIKPIKPLSPEKRQRVVMQRFAGRETDVEKVEWSTDWASAKFRDFGSFQLVVDETPPVIAPVGISDGANLSKAQRIAFTVSDNLDYFKNFRALLDGKWLRFTNDKGRTFIYQFDEMCLPGEHELQVSVEDEAGNTAVKTYRFTR
ncbi:MAG: M23 family metallopeptidase [Williamsia sp.]|nr:M23 family metallopeptidase [Williamsia sp.]